MKILRDYQDRAVGDLRSLYGSGVRRVVLRSEVGSGKTVMFSYLAASLVAKGNPVMVVCNRQKLVKQAAKHVEEAGVKPYVLMQTGMPSSETKCIVASADTLRHREWPSWIKFVIIDECHLANFGPVLERCVELGLWVLGVSATPIPNKKNRLDHYYERMIRTLSTEEHILRGDLVMDLYYAPKSAVPSLSGIKMVQTAYGRDYSEKALYAAYNRPKMYDGVVENWLLKARGKRTVCFCVNVEHSEKTAEAFRAHGISAAHLDGGHSDAERERILERFVAGSISVLCNCALFTFGWDCPSIEAVIVNRATASYELWRQMIGRGARPHGDKEFFWVIDQGNNVRKHGTLVDEVEWTLAPPKKRKKGEGVAPVKECPECEALVATSVMECPDCGHKWKVRANGLAQGEFEEIGPRKMGTWPLWTPGSDLDAYIRGCIEYRDERKYNKNSILYQIKNIPGALQKYGEINRFKEGWMDRNPALRK